MSGVWLSFVGRAYYTIPGFVKEAKKHGVSRRVSARLLSGMDWGDKVYLAQGDMAKSTRRVELTPSIVFGSFRVTRLGGIPSEVMYDIAEMFELEKVDDGGDLIQRGCGEYVTGATYVIKGASLGEIAKAVRDGAKDASLLLQGKFTKLSPMAGLPDIHFRWGFRRFDEELFEKVYYTELKKVEKTEGFDPEKDLVICPGEFRVEEAPTRVETKVKTELQEVKSYRLADLYSSIV